MEQKDSICIAQHLKAFVEQCKYEKAADFAEPCITCRLNSNCDLNAYKTFRKLSENTGIEITPLKFKRDTGRAGLQRK